VGITANWFSVGGSKSDFDNYVHLVRELRAALGKKYGLTIAVPASYCGWLPHAYLTAERTHADMAMEQGAYVVLRSKN
jgi:GH18 family chitinase